MSVGALLAELKRLGVEIEVDGNRLRYAGSQEAISRELIGRLKAYKAELIAICAKSETGERGDRDLGEAVSARPDSAPEARKLLAGGWESKERCGKLIWKHPDSGDYYSQELAVNFLGRGISDVRCKSGATERR